MTFQVIPSTNELRKAQKELRRRYQTLKAEKATVQISRAGGLYRARFVGEKDNAFGIDPQQAEQRLRHFVTIF
jgi:hypothetical protein